MQVEVSAWAPRAHPVFVQVYGPHARPEAVGPGQPLRIHTVTSPLPHRSTYNSLLEVLRCGDGEVTARLGRGSGAVSERLDLQLALVQCVANPIPGSGWGGYSWRPRISDFGLLSGYGHWPSDLRGAFFFSACLCALRVSALKEAPTGGFGLRISAFFRPSACFLSAVNAPGRAGFGYVHLGQQGQPGFELPPNPCGDVLAGGVL